MTTIPPLTEALRNQVLAALDDRIARLDERVAWLEDVKRHVQTAEITGLTTGLTEDTQRALVWNIAALHETKQARELIGEAEATVDHPADATWTNGELAETYGK